MFTLLTFFLHLRDSFRQKKRGPQIEQIAETVNWKYSRRLNLSGFGLAQHVLSGRLGKETAYIFDTPVKTKFVPNEKLWGRGGFHTSLPGTKMLIIYENRTLPLITLRPSQFADRLFTSVIKSENFATTGNDLDFLTSLFTSEVVAHYEKTQDFYLHIEGHRLLLHFHQGYYLSPIKERYLNLIAEGKYIHQLLQPYL